MRRSLPITLAGLAVCVALGVALVRARDEVRSVAAERARLSATVTVDATTIADLQKRAADLKSEMLHRRQVALATASAAERARATVGPMIAQIKADRAIHPHPTQRSPQPLPPSGTFFPELMSDPEYNQAVKESFRTRYDSWYRKTFQDLGLSPAQIDRVIDLMSERDMVRNDIQSLRTQAGRLPTAAMSKALAEAAAAEDARIMQQVRDAVGPAQVARLLVEKQYPSFELHSDGTRVAKTITRTEFVEPPLLRRARIAALETRLSYSPEPISDVQAEQLIAFSAQRPYENSIPNEIKPLLSPAQQVAVDELNAERAASQKRSRLPSPGTPMKVGAK